MKKKKIIIALSTAVLMTAFGTFGFAHGSGGGYGYGGGMMGPGMMGPGYDYGGRMMGPRYGYMNNNNLAFMSSELQLTDKQAREIYNLAEKYQAKYYEIRGNVQEAESLEKQHRREIEKILTPEQRKTFEKYQRGYYRYGWFGGCPYR